MHRIKVQIKDGRIVNGKNDIADAIRYLRNGSYAFEIKQWSGQKTWLQIKTIKGVLIPEYSNHTGYTFKEAQRMLKEEYGVVEYFTNSKDENCVEYKSFADYDIHEMRGFIDGTLQHMEYDLGIIIDLETRKKLTIDTDTGELRDGQTP